MRLSPNYHGLLAFIGARATNSHRERRLKEES